jgi:membrane protease YdiL (CAAX protease family)
MTMMPLYATAFLSRREAVLLALFPFVAVSLLNHHYAAYLHGVAPAYFWYADVAHFLLLPVLAWVLVLRPAGIGAADCGLSLSDKALQRTKAPTLLVALLVAAVTWPAFSIASASFWQYADPFSIGRVLPAQALAKLGVAIYMSATAAFVEEVAYRALPWLWFSCAVSHRWRSVAYVATTSLIFAAVHSEQGPGGVLASFWFGLVAALVYVRLRKLWPLVLAHFATDLFIFGPF